MATMAHCQPVAHSHPGVFVSLGLEERICSTYPLYSSKTSAPGEEQILIPNDIDHLMLVTFDLLLGYFVSSLEQQILKGSQTYIDAISAMLAKTSAKPAVTMMKPHINPAVPPSVRPLVNNLLID